MVCCFIRLHCQLKSKACEDSGGRSEGGEGKAEVWKFCLHKSLHSRFAYSGTHTVGLLVQGALSVLSVFLPGLLPKNLQAFLINGVSFPDWQGDYYILSRNKHLRI